MHTDGKLLPLLVAFATLQVAPLPALAGGAAGETAPAFRLRGVDGKTYGLHDNKGKVVVLEWMNPACPFSDRHAREQTMSDLAKRYRGVVWLGIDSTNRQHPTYTEPGEYEAFAKKNGVNYPVLYDETGSVGRAYGAKTTPHMFVIDPDGKIIYNGAIDDDPPGRKRKPERLNYVSDVLDAEMAHKPSARASTNAYGCSVKY
jgi:peroxiredoxin